MAIDLSDLIDAVKAEANPPGSDLFAGATDDDWLLRLENAFWEAKLFGFTQLANYTVSDDGIISPLSGTDDLPREEVQLIILFAAVNVVRMSLSNTGTAFSAKAGPVEFSTQNSATLLNAVLAGLQRKIDFLYGTLSDLGRVTDAVFDGVTERDLSLGFGEISWW